MHRPYSKIRGTEPSVTTLIGHLDKPGLSWGAARETAIYAVLHQDGWAHLSEPDAIDKLYKHHRGLWSGRAAMGTLGHAVLESFAKSEEVDIEKLVDWTIENDTNAKTWKDRDRDELIEQCLGYVMGVEKWWIDYDPEVICTEVVVRTPGKYIGQTDLRARIRGFDTVIDLKTTAQQDDGKGLYLDSWMLQLNAYSFAEESVEYEEFADKGKTRVRECGTGLWTPPERCAVIHLRGDEDYSFFDVPLDKETHDHFLSLIDIHHWLKSVGEPVAWMSEVVSV